MQVHRTGKSVLFCLTQPIVLDVDRAMYTGLNTEGFWKGSIFCEWSLFNQKWSANGIIGSTSKRKRLQIVNALSTESMHNSLSF